MLKINIENDLFLSCSLSLRSIEEEFLFDDDVFLEFIFNELKNNNIKLNKERGYSNIYLTNDNLDIMHDVFMTSETLSVLKNEIKNNFNLDIEIKNIVLPFNDISVYEGSYINNIEFGISLKEPIKNLFSREDIQKKLAALFNIDYYNKKPRRIQFDLELSTEKVKILPNLYNDNDCISLDKINELKTIPKSRFEICIGDNCYKINGFIVLPISEICYG